MYVYTVVECFSRKLVTMYQVRTKMKYKWFIPVVRDYNINLTKTNEISFNTHLLVIAYHVYMYSVTL